MSTAIELLMQEHRRIERALDRLEQLAGSLPAPGDARERLSALVSFFREFADRHHHGKEEAILFELMEGAGVPRESGPIGCMLEEHDLGRQLVTRLAEVAAGEGPLGPEAWAEVARVAPAFASLLRAHIHKEDAVLYPMATVRLGGAELAALDEQCEAFEREKRADGTRARLDALVEAVEAVEAS